ncbi:MAG: hypothetical protein H7244_08590 [Herminiimonas sp.]|nr:hypothetical protein [Herminiimonas sp.]
MLKPKCPAPWRVSGQPRRVWNIDIILPCIPVLEFSSQNQHETREKLAIEEYGDEERIEERHIRSPKVLG